MILIVSWPEDDHARAVQRELAALGREATLLDLSRFPQHLRVAFTYEDARRRYRILDEGREIALERYGVIWWRRPQPFVLHPEIAEGPHATFAYTEASEALSGMWQSLDTAWINHPVRDEAAGRKLYQLRVAQGVGLEVPETLVTNDPDQARRFVNSQGPGGVAYKAFLPSAAEWRETRILRPDELSQLDAVRYAPVIFQEYVPAALDLRITVVGDAIQAAAIHSADTAYQADYRMELGSARVEPFRLPEDVTTALRGLMERLGLVYGAIDMRLDPDGRYVFFEVNPAGQWLFVEERTGQPITAMFARLLTAHADGQPAADEGMLSDSPLADRPPQAAHVEG